MLLSVLAAAACKDLRTAPASTPDDLFLSGNQLCGVDCVIADNPAVLTSVTFNADSAAAGIFLGESTLHGTVDDWVGIRLEMSPTLRAALPLSTRIIARIDGQRDVSTTLDAAERGSLVFRFGQGGEVRVRYFITPRFTTQVGSGEFRLLQLLGGDATVKQSWRPWLLKDSEPVAHSFDPSCEVIAASATVCGVGVTVAPFFLTSVFGPVTFTSRSGSGASIPITVSFSASVNNVVITIHDPTFAGNSATAFDGSGATLGSVDFTFTGQPGNNVPNTQVLSHSGIRTVVLTPAAADFVTYNLWFELGALQVTCVPATPVRATDNVVCEASSTTPGDSVTVSSWEFLSDSGWKVTRATNADSLSWAGKMIHSGTVTVTGTVAGVADTASTRVTVLPRSWANLIPAYPTALPLDTLTPSDFPALPVVDSANGSQTWPDRSLAEYRFGLEYLGYLDLVSGGPNHDVLYFETAPPWVTPLVHRSEHLEVGNPFYEAQTGKRQGEGNPPKSKFPEGWCTKSHMDTLKNETRMHEGSVASTTRKSHHEEVRKYVGLNDPGPKVEGIGFLAPTAFEDSVLSALNRAYYNAVEAATNPIVHASSNLYTVSCKAHIP